MNPFLKQLCALKPAFIFNKQEDHLFKFNNYDLKISDFPVLKLLTNLN